MLDGIDEKEYDELLEWGDEVVTLAQKVVKAVVNAHLEREEEEEEEEYPRTNTEE
jgi:hypothetical protein